MAEEIPYGVASSLIYRLASEAFREFGRIYGVVDELERLKNTVESIRAVLLDAEEKQEQNNAVQNWIRRLKDVLHPADDLLDEFFIQEMKRKVAAHHHHKNKSNQVLHCLLPKRIVFRHKLARQIEKTRKKFNDVVGEISLLKLNPNDVVVVVKQTEILEWETSSAVLKSDIIGRTEDKKQIISLLQQPHSHNSQNVSLIAIVGIGGLGKTALAQLVYNDEEVQKSFDKKMWVCVSDNFEVKTILKNMLESLINNKVNDNLSLENLKNRLSENLRGKKYILVLDDIWNESHERWSQLRPHLMCGARDSKVLVTTRSKIVAHTMGASVSYPLEGLDPIQSWSLLKKISFWDDSEPSVVNRSLEPIGKEIAKKCKGVPLAIRTLGGLLQGKRKVSEWIGVLQGEFWKLYEDKKSIMPVLKRSYQNLSPQLRQCFSYCSLYPKDSEIEKDELIQLWMAQGYLECSAENRHIEDLGNEFVKIFLMKSFFQDAKMSQWGDINTFKMHDLMHDLAMQVAGSDCCYLDSKTNIPVERPMHVSLDCNAIELLVLDSLEASRLHTLILVNSVTLVKSLNEKLSVISKFKHLRVLKLEGFSLEKLAGSFKKLEHLRCLILLYCREVKSLYQSITNLVCLQTLVLKNPKEYVELKNPEDYFEFSTQDLSKLTNLIYLDIDGFAIDSKEKKMSGGFQNLSLANYWLSSFTNIVKISLIECNGIQYLPPLERLPFLKSLSLDSLAHLEYICCEDTTLPGAFFQSLESLTFRLCSRLEGWRRMGDNFNDDKENSSKSQHHHPLPPFPCLSLLSIKGCWILKHMPTFPSLDKKLELVNCSLQVLEATLNTTFDFPPLSILNSLRIGTGWVNLDVIKVPKVWTHNLSSLRDLQIYGFASGQIQEFGTWSKNGLNCLEKITFEGDDEEEYLDSLPDWICNLSSLKHIKVKDNGPLTSLPEGMTRLTNLHTLEVISRNILAEKFLRETGEFWPKIAHIPNIITQVHSFKVNVFGGYCDSSS